MSFKCHICSKGHDTEDDLRIHLLFTHQFFKQACETNRVVIDWEHKNYMSKTRAWNRGCVKRWEKTIHPRWLRFWDSIEGTKNWNGFVNEKTRYYYHKNPKKHIEIRRKYAEANKERLSIQNKEEYYRRKKFEPMWWEVKKKKRRDYYEKTKSKKIII